MFFVLILAYFLIMMAVTFAADNAAVPFVMGAALILILLVVGEAKRGTRSGSGKTPGPGRLLPRPGRPAAPTAGALSPSEGAGGSAAGAVISGKSLP